MTSCRRRLQSAVDVWVMRMSMQAGHGSGSSARGTNGRGAITERTVANDDKLPANLQQQ